MPFLRNRGVSIYYEFTGEKKNTRTVAFLNGVMASTTSWAFYTQALEGSGYQFLLHDFRGQLLSDKPPGPYTFAQHLEDFRLLLDHHEISSVDLVGTSYGGEIALRAAIDMPERVNSVTIIDSVSEIDALLRSFVDLWIALARIGDPEAFFWGVVPSLYSSWYLEEHRDALAVKASQLKKLSPNFLPGQIALYETFLREVNFTEELHSISCPVLILCGEEDILKPPRFSRLIAEKVPNSQFVLIPRCGHVAIYEAPELISEMIIGFLLNLD